MAVDINPFEAAARTVKAHRLADVLAACNLDADAAIYISPESWAIVARLAHVRTPSGQTRTEVAAILRARENVARRLGAA